jgi:hypothetical protein
MSTTIPIPIKVRSFTGSKILPFEFDPNATISVVKDAVASSALCKAGANEKPSLEYNGHELSDDKTLSYYGVKENGVLHIREWHDRACKFVANVVCYNHQCLHPRRPNYRCILSGQTAHHSPST